jgi:hypothetical protein
VHTLWRQRPPPPLALLPRLSPPRSRPTLRHCCLRPHASAPLPARRTARICLRRPRGQALAAWGSSSVQAAPQWTARSLAATAWPLWPRRRRRRPSPRSAAEVGGEATQRRRRPLRRPRPRLQQRRSLRRGLACRAPLPWVPRCCVGAAPLGPACTAPAPQAAASCLAAALLGARHSAAAPLAAAPLAAAPLAAARPAAAPWGPRLQTSAWRLAAARRSRHPRLAPWGLERTSLVWGPCPHRVD